MSSKNIGFWTLLSIVLGAQIGAGIMTRPTALVPFGFWGQIGWLFSAGGAMVLALLFANLSKTSQEAGGPHIYIQKAFGEKIGFFMAFAYWMVSWISTLILVITAVAYLKPFLPYPDYIVVWEIFVFSIFVCINLMGTKFFSKIDICLMILKISPILMIPISLFLFLPNIDTSSAPAVDMPWSTCLMQGTFLTFWGFIGVESATAPANMVKNPSKNIPLAIVIGTSLVAILYMINSFSFYLKIPTGDILGSAVPYAVAFEKIFHNQWMMPVIGAIVCMGCINNWILISAEIAYGASRSGFFHPIFQKKNTKGTPYASILLSSIGMIPLIFMSASPDLFKQMESIIDTSSVIFLVVYLMSCAAHLKILKGKIIPMLGIIFCFTMIVVSGMTSVFIGCALMACGIPFYLSKKGRA